MDLTRSDGEFEGPDREISAVILDNFLFHSPNRYPRVLEDGHPESMKPVFYPVSPSDSCTGAQCYHFKEV